MNPGNVCIDFGVAASGFLNQIKNNPRVGPTHISLFMTILSSAEKQKLEEPISAFSKDLMQRAKISGIATYHKCVQDLQELGFIKYVPSYNPLLGSLFYILKLQK